MKPLLHALITSVVTLFIVAVALIGIFAGLGRK